MRQRRDGKGGPGERSEELEDLRRRVAELEEMRRRLERENAELVFENDVLRRLRLSPRAAERARLPLLSCLLSLLSEWSSSFGQARVFAHARDVALGLIVNGQRNTVTGVLRALGLEDQDWSAIYRLFSRARFDHAGLFVPVLRRGLSHDRRSGSFIAVAVDDSSVRKTGMKNRSVRVLRAPLSPPYHPNLEPRQRFVVTSVLLRPEGESGPCWAVPAGFGDAPPAGRPRRGASEEELARHAEAQKALRLGRQAAELCEGVAGQIGSVTGEGLARVLWCVDGSLTNRCFLDRLPSGTEFIGRVRKDAALHAPANAEAPGSWDRRTRRVYGERLASPEAVLVDDRLPLRTVEVYAARAVRTAEFKEVGPVLWRQVTKRRPLRLIVIRAPRYRRRGSGKLDYRQPAYLLTSDLTSPVEHLVQAYVDRWEIEPGFRDLKTEFGLGDAQVWSAASVGRVPSFVTATYGALKVACLEAFGPHRVEAYGTRAKWRNDERLRPSLSDARDRVRVEVGMLGGSQGPSAARWRVDERALRSWRLAGDAPQAVGAGLAPP